MPTSFVPEERVFDGVRGEIYIGLPQECGTRRDGEIPFSEDLLAEMKNPILVASNRELVVDEITKLRRSNFRSLNFPRPLEEQLERDTAKERSHRLWLEGLVAILVLNGCLFVDYLAVKDVVLKSTVERTAIVTPVALLIICLMRLKLARWAREGSVAVAMTLSCFINLYVERGVTAATAMFGLISVLIAVLFVNVVMRLRLPYAVGSTMLMLMGGLWFIYHANGVTGSEKTIGASMMTLGILVTLTAGYSLERQERLSYVLFLSSEMQRTELHRLSNVDKLTELPNRRAFDERFERLWADGMQAGTPLSAVVIDIDQFKRVNDVFGHLYGDEVLRRVGGLLPTALRVKDDLVARFGGEEFVILLPNTKSEMAMIVAERVCRLVEMVGTPVSGQGSEKPAMLITVSCGVSTYVPDGRLSRERLLKMADRALYQAKANGRNRVEFRSCEPASGSNSSRRNATALLLTQLEIDHKSGSHTATEMG